MLPNVSGGGLSGGRGQGRAQLAKPLHHAFYLRVIQPAAIEADEVLEASGWIIAAGRYRPTKSGGQWLACGA
jgi:hypothetical protein